MCLYGQTLYHSKEHLSRITVIYIFIVRIYKITEDIAQFSFKVLGNSKNYNIFYFIIKFILTSFGISLSLIVMTQSNNILLDHSRTHEYLNISISGKSIETPMNTNDLSLLTAKTKRKTSK